MDSQSKIDKTFHQLRKMPDEIPLEKVEQFVLAQAALGLTAAAAPSLLKKLAIKFHLNSFIVMTTTATASIASLLIWASTWHKQEHVQHNFTKHPQTHSSFTASAPDVSLPTDSPASKTTTTISVSSSSNQAPTTTNITIVSKGDSVVTTVKTSGSDSSYVYKTSSGNAQRIVVSGSSSTATSCSLPSLPSIPEIPAIPEMPAIAMSPDGSNGDLGNLPSMDWNIPPMPPLAPCTPHTNDSLLPKIEDQLVKDGLISDRKHYAFKIAGNSLKVNGVKQSNDVYKRYKEIIETNSHNKVNRKFVYAVSVDGDSTTMDLENYED